MSSMQVLQAIRTYAKPLTAKRFLYWFGSGAVVGVLLIVGWVIRQPLDTNISTVEGFYTPNVQYGIWYLANNHHLFDAVDGTPRISNYTAGLNYGAIDFTNTYLTGAVLVLSRETDFEHIGKLYSWTPWQGLLLIPLSAVAIYARVARIYRTPVSPQYVSLLYGFVAFSSYPMIVWSISAGFATPLGWAVFYGIFLAMLAVSTEKDFTWQWTSVLISCILLVQSTYHTAALVLVILLPTVWIVQRLLREKFVAFGLIRLTVVIFLSFLMYHAVLLFSDYGRLLVRFLSDIYRSSDEDRLRYSLVSAGMSIWWNIINYLAILVPVLWVSYVTVFKKHRSQKDKLIAKYLFAWMLSLVPLTVLLFAWDGVLGAYARTLQYGTLLAITCASYLLATRRASIVPLFFVTLICITTSTVSMRTLDVSASNYVTQDELHAIEWIKQADGCDHVVFTDFRIGTTFGYQGCFSVIGPTAGPLAVRKQVGVLNQLFYQGDSAVLPAAIDTLMTIDKRRPDIILLSRRFLDDHIGIVLPDTRLKPMSDQQWQAYRQLIGWKIVFENSTTMVLKRQD